MTLSQHIYQSVTIDQRDSDGYINLNQMANATGKRIALDTHKERRLKRFIEEEKTRKQLEMDLDEDGAS